MSNQPKPKEHWNGYCWSVRLTEHWDAVGRTIQDARRTAKRIADGEVWYDSDGIGIRINTTINNDGVTFERA